MNTAGLAGLVLGLLALAALVIVLVVRQRKAAAWDRTRPRTVADLVRLRAEQAAAAPQEALVTGPAEPATAVLPAVEKPAEPVVVSEPVTAPVRRAVIVAATNAASEAAAKAAANAESRAAVTPEAVVPAVIAPAQQKETPPHFEAAPQRAAARRPTGDTPWGRAARMAGGEGAEWDLDAELDAELDPAAHDDPVATPSALEPSARPALSAVPVEPPIRSVLAAIPRESDRAGGFRPTLVARTTSIPDDSRRAGSVVPFRVTSAARSGAEPAGGPSGEKTDGEDGEGERVVAEAPVAGTAEPDGAADVAPEQPAVVDGVVVPVPEADAPEPDAAGGPDLVVEEPVAEAVEPAEAPVAALVEGHTDTDTAEPEPEAAEFEVVESAAPTPEPTAGAPTQRAVPTFVLPPAVVLPAAAHLATLAATAPARATTDQENPEVDPSDDAPARRQGARARRSPAETAAEQAAADLALLRTFGFTDVARKQEPNPVVSLAAAEPATGTVDGPGAPAVVRFRVVGRDQAGLTGAAVTLLDDRGHVSCDTTADADGRGELGAPHGGGYMLVATAPGHQPGAVTIMVTGDVTEAEVPLARSSSLGGTVYGEDGPVVSARVTLVQDGEVVDSVDTGADGTYLIADLGPGEYGLSVSAPDCEPVATLVEVRDGADLTHDVDLEPAGLPVVPAVADDLVIGHC